ncbi:TIR domain-containing protein [Hyphomicrobium sp. DY-1]|uniref:TIR domain-containing protein n=1 Tax=Hyphomicrobium sp. DY-1 TaxID=3075650 RepID=UPI0039C4088A
MTPTATRLHMRLDERYLWFHNQWFFKWHHIGAGSSADIDTFDGRQAHYGGIKFSGSPRNVYWWAIVRGTKKEVIEQFTWVEEAVRNYSPAVAIQAIDECAGALMSFVGKLRRAAIEKDRILRGDGINFPAEHDSGNWEDVSDQAIVKQAEALKAALFPPAPEAMPPAVKADATASAAPRAYQVALSFAGEQRAYVREVARHLVARGVAVFYDEFEATNLWGKDGVEYFHKVFTKDARHAVMFISEAYVAKKWTRHERRSALSRAISADDEYLLPVRFDDTPLPGIPDTLQYLRAADFSPAALTVKICEKLGIGAGSAKASDIAPPAAHATVGEVTFDYSAYNGGFLIGSGPFTFETKWSKASNERIHLYNDPPSIDGVAIAKGAGEIAAISDASAFDFTSRSRSPAVGEIAILRNSNGFYAAIQIVDIQDDTRDASQDSLTFRYVIQTDGTADFGRLQSTEASQSDAVSS